MDDRIEEVVKRSSEPLKDDWTLEQEVAQELRTHLEDKCAELEGEGNSPEESVKKAIGEFGDPDEIGRGLLGANFRRMKLRGKLKAVLRICGIPLLLAAVWATVDFSVLAGAARYCSVSTVNSEFSVKCDWAARFFGRFAGFRKPAGEPPLRNGGDGLNARKADEMRLELVNRHPDDPVCLANYVAEVVVRDKRPESVKAVKLAIGREPDNALYHHLLSALILEEAFEADRTAMEECEIKDRAKLDAAKAEYLLGLKCPYYRLYIPERMQRARSQYAGNAFHARMQRKVAGLMLPIPALPRQRSVARAAIYYPELLIRDGRPEEAEALLDQWYVYPAQLLESSDLLISMLIVDTILELNQKKLPELYARVGKPEKGKRIAAKIAEARASMAAWKAQRKEADDRAQEEAKRHGGIFSFFLVGLGNSLPAEYLRSDRIMTYCILDSLVLLCFTVLVLCVVGFQTLCWSIGRACGEEGIFPVADEARIRQTPAVRDAASGGTLLALAARRSSERQRLRGSIQPDHVLRPGFRSGCRAAGLVPVLSRAYPVAPLSDAGSAGGGEAPRLPAVPDLCDDGDSALDRLSARGRRRAALRGQPGNSSTTSGATVRSSPDCTLRPRTTSFRLSGPIL